ncbi:MAG: EutN/CcmL family microcompartment protein [Rhodospirillales bacterium]|jgi:ethanolamine utilization protein EutN|nr:EutN/CcmL family microcompartment protein [Rhodospirillales bacterium]
MQRGTVVGSIWSTKRLEAVPKGGLQEIEMEDGDARVVAFDPIGVGHGERVLVVQGSVAAAWFGDRKVPIDALIIGVIDEENPRR